MTEIGELIQSIGFPIAVAIWLMYRVETILEKQRKEQNRTNTLLAVIVRVLDSERAFPTDVVNDASGVTRSK